MKSLLSFDKDEDDEEEEATTVEFKMLSLSTMKTFCLIDFKVISEVDIKNI